MVQADCTFLTGLGFYAHIYPEILKAKEEIKIATYCLSLPTHTKRNMTRHFSLALVKKLKQGVELQIILPRQGVNKFIWETNAKSSLILGIHGANIIFSNCPHLLHAKLIIIDRKIVIVGSHNLTQRAFASNLDASVKIVSAIIAQKALAFYDALLDPSKYNIIKYNKCLSV